MKLQINDFKNVNFFPREALISGEGRPENLGKTITETSIVTQFRKRILAFIPGIKILVMPQFSHVPDQILEKNEKT